MANSQANRGGHFGAPSGGLQLTAVWVDSKHLDRIGSLVGGQQEIAEGVDGKIARLLASGLFNLHQLQAFGSIAKNGDRVMASIASVDKFPRRMQNNFGSGSVARKKLTGFQRL